MSEHLAYYAGTDAHNIMQIIDSWYMESVTRHTQKHADIKKSILLNYIMSQHIISIQQITKQSVQAFLAMIAANGRKRSTIKQKKDSISSFIEFCINESLLTANPCRKIRLPSRTIHEPRFLTEAQQEQLYKLANEQGIYFEVLLALKTGMRLNEMRLLRWEDINWDSDTIMVRTDNAKSSRYRVIPMHPDINKQLSLKVKLDSGYIFEGKIGQPKCPRTWVNLLNHIRDKMPCFSCGASDKGPGRAWHLLRSTCFSMMVQRGVPIEIVSKIAGHRDIRVTLDHYAALAPQYLRKGIEVL